MSKRTIDIKNDKLLDILIEDEYRLISKLQDERKRLEKGINDDKLNNHQEIREIHNLIQSHRTTRDIIKREIQIRLTESTFTAKNSKTI